MIINFIILKPQIETDTQQKIKPKKNFDRKPFWFILAVAIIIGFAYLPNNDPAVRAMKKAKEIEGIKVKTYKPPKDDCDSCCVQYALKATKDGWYPCYSDSCKGGEIWLKRGEVWKYGKTCLEKKRYDERELFKADLVFIVEFKGNESQCLIMEKEKIYNYPNLPECKVRGIVLLRPPGNKIDK